MESQIFSRDWVGRVVDGKFTLLEWLGGSGRDGVFLTELVEGPRSQKAAVKLVSADAPDAEARFAAWTAAMRLSHPHLIRVFRAGRDSTGSDRLIYAVMEYGDEVLAQVIPERPITPDEAREMLGPVLDALSYLHLHGYAHGRIKPANILVINNQLKLSEDNIRIGERRSGALAPTVYDAPETATHPAAPAIDLWSLGVTLVEALTQQTPAVDRSTHQDPAVPGFVPEPFAAIAQNCLHRNPARRWSLSQIKAHLDGAPGDSAPETREEAVETPSKKLWTAVLIAAALLLVVGVAVLLLRPHQPHPSPSTPPAQASTPAAPAATSQPQPAPAPAGAAAPQPQSASAPPATSPSQSGAPAGGEIAQRVLPDVPRKASDTIHGKFDVSVRVNVDAQGQVASATIASAGPSHYFANLALEASRSWKFKPALDRGNPVSSVWTLRYEFRQDGIDATATQESP